MTAFLPTTRVTINRDYSPPTLSKYGDEIDGSRIIATGVPVAVTPSRAPRSFAHGDQVSYVPADNRGGVVERFNLRFRPTVDVREQDRLSDEIHGFTYLVTAVSNPQAVAGKADVRATAHRVGATSLPVNG